MSDVKIMPVVRLEAEKLLGDDGEYAVDFLKPGWLAECRRTGGTFLLYPQTSVDALAVQRDEGLAREAELRKTLAFSDENQIRQGLRINNLREEVSALQQRLADAEKPQPLFVATVQRKLRRFEECASDNQGADIGSHWFEVLTRLGLLNRVQRSPALWEFTDEGEQFLGSPGCADGEKPATPAINLSRRKVKTEYSSAEEDAQADAWNAAIDAVQELNR